MFLNWFDLALLQYSTGQKSDLDCGILILTKCACASAQALANLSSISGGDLRRAITYLQVQMS